MFRASLITLLITVLFSSSAFAQTQPRPRDSRWNGFLIGVVAGAVPGVLLGLGVKRYCSNEARSCDSAVPLAGALGGLVGGFVGAAVDDSIGNSIGSYRPRPAPGVRFSIRF
jgi:hypothetical protein